ncbi:hypothetical protein [Streptomyces sp. NPDC046261]|uniref:hypothetical protein n=1 Tax=Streptomyces sp. NPDC046261 TaxID=3157200 RepID=UPI0033EEC01E
MTSPSLLPTDPLPLSEQLTVVSSFTRQVPTWLLVLFFSNAKEEPTVFSSRASFIVTMSKYQFVPYVQLCWVQLTAGWNWTVAPDAAASVPGSIAHASAANAALWENVNATALNAATTADLRPAALNFPRMTVPLPEGLRLPCQDSWI